METQRIVCVGGAVWDSIFKVDHVPSGGGKVLPENAVQAGSGMAVAAAVAIARLGGEVALLTRVGDDMTGRMFIEDMRREGIPTENIRQAAGGRTAFSAILVDRTGERIVVPYFDAALDPDASWLPLGEIEGAGAVLCDMRWMEGARAVLERARREGVPTILDADVAPLHDLRALIGLADHLLFSEPALQSLGSPGTAEEAVRRIAREVDAEVIGVTLGERGALLWQRASPDHVVHVPTIAIRAIDTLNAGDVWHGTYAYGLVNGWSLVRRARAANVAAAIKCERFGGLSGAPSLSDLERRLRQSETT